MAVNMFHDVCNTATRCMVGPAAAQALSCLMYDCRFGSEPSWSVLAESYPVGCAYSDCISGSGFLTACPDRRCASYCTPTGIYSAACGLDAVHFTWTSTEYLTLVLLLNRTNLPFEAIFLLRFQNFFSAINHSAYSTLFSERDRAAMPLLRRFAALQARVHTGEAPPAPRLPRDALIKQCRAAAKRYLVSDALRW